VYNENSDVICVTETWLTDEVSNKEILHSGFTIYRKDRTNRCGGGVLIAIKTETFKSVKEYQPGIEELQQLEIVSTEVETANNQKLLYCCCYRPPDADLSWTDAFNTFLNHACEQYQNIVISGDFNFPKIQWDEMDKTNSVNELLFVEMLNDHFLCQINNTPTRGNNVLDLVITSVPNHVRLTEILSPEQSSVYTDHSAISFDFTAFIKAPQKSVRTVYDYAKGDLDGLRAALQATDLSSLISDSDNIDNDWQHWKNTFLTIVSTFIPKKKIRGRNPLPWITSNILHKIKKKDSIRRKLKVHPTSYLIEKYRSLRSEIKKLLRESREKYFGSIDSSFKNNPKRFWSALKQTSKSCSIPDRVSMPPSPTTTSPNAQPSFLNQAQTDLSNLPSRPTATNPNEIADFFNTYFASVFTSENLPVQHLNRTDDPVLTDLNLTELEVETLLNSLDTNKATGSDEIPARLLKETASIIAPSIRKLFNKSLNQGTVPQDWKLANVVPVYKKGDKEYTENYRPISLLPIISKVLERCIFMNIRHHFSQIIYDHQHGFLQGKSCVTNLLEALDYVGACLDSGGQVDMVYLDMSKAFDRINHKRLMQKLANSGIGGNLLKWFRSYLTDRRQHVTVLGVTSKTLPVCSGVPQGSILGPALFLLYVNDLLEAPTSSRAAMFADDTKLFSAIKSKDDVTALQTDLGTLEQWSTVSGLSFNQSKCKHQTLTRKLVPVASSYKLDDTIISSTDNEKDLGVWVSSDLTWKKQVNEQTVKANRILGYVRRNTLCIKNTAARRALYLALVRSHFGYATQIWSPQSVDLISKLERTQRRATKYILNLPFSTTVDYKSRLRSLNLLPVSYWHEYLDLILFFKITHGLVILNSDYTPAILVTRRTTRSTSSNTLKYVIPKCRTTTYQKSFLVRACRLWNYLADELKLTVDTSLAVFKSDLLNYYFTSLNINYNPEDSRTFKSICLKCNCVRSLSRPISCCW
jgi:hypothetical protein